MIAQYKIEIKHGVKHVSGNWARIDIETNEVEKAYGFEVSYHIRKAPDIVCIIHLENSGFIYDTSDEAIRVATEKIERHKIDLEKELI